jgi:mercuric ion binding protein
MSDGRDVRVSCFRFSQAVFDTSSMRAEHDLCQPTHTKAPAHHFLDRFATDCRPVSRPYSGTDFLTLKRTTMRLSSQLLPLAVLVAAASSVSAAELQTTVLDVQNMTCSLCPVTVQKALQKVPGIQDAKVDFDHKTATVKFDPVKVNSATLAKATTDAGFPSTVHK